MVDPGKVVVMLFKESLSRIIVQLHPEMQIFQEGHHKAVGLRTLIPGHAKKRVVQRAAARIAVRKPEKTRFWRENRSIFKSTI